MDLTKYKRLLLTLENRVLTIMLNRPDQLNATDETMHTEISYIFHEISGEPDIDIVVLTGAGRAFSAGGSYESMQLSIDNPSHFDHTAIEAKRMVFSMLDCQKPIIAKVNGHAVGFGCTLALYADIVYMNESAKIGDPHVNVGYVAGDGGAAIWAQRIGYTKAKQYLLTGDLLTGRQAAEIGLINHAVPLDGLDDAVQACVDKLLAKPAKALQWTKLAINVGMKQIVHPVLEAGIAYEYLSMRTEDHREAIAALREKRTPVFKGR
jgi:enoyl-CoA hydratase